MNNVIKDFSQLTNYLKKQSIRKKVAVICAYDDHTEFAVSEALKDGFVSLVMVGDKDKVKNYPALQQFSEFVSYVDIKDSDEAARVAVTMARNGEVDILMKGIINTDNLLKAILNKEYGILPSGKVMTHLALIKIPTYDKFLFFTDAAVIPCPSLEQRSAMIEYVVNVCRKFKIDTPRVALTHCTEKVSPKFPFTLDYETIKEKAKAGDFGSVIIDGPMDVKTACDSESLEIKGINSPIEGKADVLVFPEIESGNTFYKAMTLFAKADIAGLLLGPSCPVILSSRSDSGESKYYSIAMACIS